MEQYTYYIIYKEGSKVAEMRFNIGGKSRDSTIIKLKGKSIKRVFSNLINLLSRYGGIIPIEVTDYESIYGVRDDLGPLVGAYVLMLRRARNYNKWHRFLERLLEEEYPGIVIILSEFLEMALELSKEWSSSGTGKSKKRSQKAFDLVSSTLKHFVNRLERLYRSTPKR